MQEFTPGSRDEPSRKPFWIGMGCFLGVLIVGGGLIGLRWKECWIRFQMNRLESDNWVARHNAIRALASEKFVNPDVLTRIETCMDDQDPHVRRIATLAFTYHDNRIPISRIEKLLGSAEADDRVTAVIVIRRQEESALLPMTLSLLHDPDEEVRGYAAAAVGKLGKRSHIPRLIPLLDDPNQLPRSEGLCAILLLAGEDATRLTDENVAATRAWWEAHKDDPEFRETPGETGPQDAPR